jgi:hypothetical protein
LAAQPFAVRVFGDERFELPDQLGMAVEGEVGFDPLLDGREPQVLEASDLGLREWFEGELGERRSAPEGERFVQESGCTFGVA